MQAIHTHTKKNYNSTSTVQRQNLTYFSKYLSKLRIIISEKKYFYTATASQQKDTVVYLARMNKV